MNKELVNRSIWVFNQFSIDCQLKVIALVVGEYVNHISYRNIS